MARQHPIKSAMYWREYYARNAETLRAKKRGPARAYKQRVLLQRAIESARIDLNQLNLNPGSV